MAEPFVCIGAMKCGTTTLHRILNGHPDVKLVAEKEASQLQDRVTARRLARRISRSSAVVAGEVSTAYMQAPLISQPVERAAVELGGQLRIVAILRDPYERALSHWRHWMQLEREGRPVEEALLDPDGAYQAFSSYSRQLEPWVDRFGDGNVHLIKLEDYQGQPGASVAALWEFLGVVPRDEDATEVHANSGSHRVVAVGAGQSLRSLYVYRLLRPLVPSSARRRVAAALGGAKSRQMADPTPELRLHFNELISEDLFRLHQRWPVMRWD